MKYRRYDSTRFKIQTLLYPFNVFPTSNEFIFIKVGGWIIKESKKKSQLHSCGDWNRIVLKSGMSRWGSSPFFTMKSDIYSSIALLWWSLQIIQQLNSKLFSLKMVDIQQVFMLWNRLQRCDAGNKRCGHRYESHVSIRVKRVRDQHSSLQSHHLVNASTQ